MALPTAVFDPTTTIKPVFLWASITPAGGSLIDIPLTKLEGNLSVSTTKRMIPQGDFIMQDRVLATTREQSYVATTSDFVAAQRDLAFGSAFTEGVCTLWATDPADDTLDVKWKTNAFACTVLPESDASFDPENFSEYSFRIEANEIVTETFDGTA